MEKRLINLSTNQECTSKKIPSLDPLYSLVGANSDVNFHLTSSGAEGVCQVLLSCFLEISRKTGKCHFVTSTMEDAPTLQMMRRLEELGCFVKLSPLNDNGEIDVFELEKLITPRTALVSIAMAQGVTGVIQPFEQIAALCKKKGVFLHLEASHAVGKCHFSMSEMEANYLSFSGTSIGAGKRSGVLFSSKSAPLVPLVFGEEEQSDIELIENLNRASTNRADAIDAFSLEMPRLKRVFEKKLLELIPTAKVLYKNSLQLPNTCVICFPFAHQDSLCFLLNEKGIKTEIGGGKSQALKSLLESGKIDLKDAMCSLSFSFPSDITIEKLLEVATQIKECVDKLQKIATEDIVGYDPSTYLSGAKEIPKRTKEKASAFKFTGSYTQELASQKGMRLAVGTSHGLTLYLLVDETDGEIADVKYKAFGPMALFAIGEVLAEFLIRKDVVQASRITADIIEKQLISKNETLPKGMGGLINQGIFAVDEALETCQDIECKTESYETTPISFETDPDGSGLADWHTYTKNQKLQLIEEVIDKEIRPYIELDAGGIKIIEFNENNEIKIAYEGACTSCPSATGSTLSAIQQILRARLCPAIVVIPEF